MKAVIFDFDGTIADSLYGVLAMYERAHKRDIPISTEDIEGFRNKSLVRIARDMRIPLWKFIPLGLFGRRWFRRYIDRVKTYEGIPELLRDLHRRNISVYILSTNRAENIHDFLKAHGLEDYVRAVYGKAFILNKTPKLRLLMHQENLEPSEVVYVGDEIVDVMAARRADIESVAVTWGYTSRDILQKTNPDVLIDKVTELKNTLA